MLPALSRWLGFPLADLYCRTSVLRHLRQFHGTQWESPEELARRQVEKLQHLLAHASEHVPYYRKVMAERGLRPADFQSIGDLATLPVVSRARAQRQGQRLWADDLVFRKVSAGYTGGSTGEPLGVIRDRASKSAAHASLLRGLRWAGYRLGDRMAVVWGEPLRPSRIQRFRSRARDLLFNWTSFDGFRVSQDQLRRDAARLRRLSPAFIRGYPSSLDRLARHCLDSGIADIRPKGISTTAEVLLDVCRERIHEAFGCPVFDQYGCNEVMGVAAECTAHEGLHVSSEHVICEILKDGEPAAPGEIGELVLTDLDNQAMAFIRYAPGDLAAWAPAPCSCGRHLPRIQSVVGRIADIIVGPSGQAAHGMLFSRALAQLDWFGDYRVRQFQVVQTAPDALTIRLASRTSPPPDAVRELTSHLQDYLGPVRVELEPCEEIEAGPSGKLRVCRSEIGPNRSRHSPPSQENDP